MNLTARERLLMSLTAKQVEDIMDNMNTPTVNIPLIDYPPLEIDVIHPAKLSHLILDIHDLLDLHMTLKDRDQRIIKENIITITSDELRFVKLTDKEMRDRANEAFRPKENK